MKRRTALRTLFATAAALCALPLVSTGSGAGGAGGAGGAPTARAQAQTTAASEFRRVVVTPADIARLPRGEKYVVELGGDAQAAGGTYTGTTNVNNGTLSAADKGGRSGGSLTKAGAGTLTLGGANSTGAANKTGRHIIYAFQNESGKIDFGRVAVREAAGAAPVALETWLRSQMTPQAMASWPFKSLVIGPAPGVAQIKGWKAGSNPPPTKYVCSSLACACSGAADCYDLASSSSCTGSLTCNGDVCACKAD